MPAQCSLLNRLLIERTAITAYSQLASWHYRNEKLGPYTAVFGARRPGSSRWLAVIVYAMPQIGSATRAKAMAALNAVRCPPNAGIDERIRWLNASLRCICRVVVDPRYRGIGLAVRIVRETLPLAGVPFVEAIAAMGRANPFLERAGMTRFDTPSPQTPSRLRRVLALLGIASADLIDPLVVNDKIDALQPELRLFLEAEVRLFLKPCVKRRNMPHSLERTRFVLSRLGPAPAYYLWIKP
ncbi:MAG TPA: hypothetical protein VLH60_04220 [Sedimentisphaerales bacterium]|nr:hypothetical protein [Sedimentisphaerales bacterium]